MTRYKRQKHTGYRALESALLLLIMQTVGAAGCMARCGADVPMIARQETESYCSISLPDNPYRSMDTGVGDIAPCQLEIHSNCSEYCHIELNFDKFGLPECDRNVTNTTEICDIIDSCEYIILKERGIDLNGAEPSDVMHFHGNYTRQSYQSKTDKILLQFCYRSETFSARNIRVKFKTFDPTREEPFYAGPVSVYIISLLVVLMCVGIGVIRWSSAIKRCLGPAEENPQYPVDV